SLRRTLSYVAFFSLLWWALTDGSTQQLWMGALVVVLTSALALFISRDELGARTDEAPLLPRFIALMKLIPYFFYQSLKGGVIVARLACLPQSRLHPHTVSYEMKIPREAVLARVCFGSCLCIFPGSLSCGYDDDILKIHVL